MLRYKQPYVHFVPYVYIPSCDNYGNRNSRWIRQSRLNKNISGKYTLQKKKNEGKIKNGHSRDTGSNGHMIQNEDKQNKTNTAQKTKKTTYMDTIKNRDWTQVLAYYFIHKFNNNFPVPIKHNCVNKSITSFVRKHKCWKVHRLHFTHPVIYT